MVNVLETVLETWEDKSPNGGESFYFDTSVACISKVKNKNNLYFHLEAYLCTRVLKLMRLIVAHELQIEKQLKRTFDKIAEKVDDLTDAHSLMKNRINDLIMDFNLYDHADG